jgi:hypothetical protein
VSGHIVNEIETGDDGELQLRFTYTLELAGIPPGRRKKPTTPRGWSRTISRPWTPP